MCYHLNKKQHMEGLAIIVAIGFYAWVLEQEHIAPTP